MLWRNQSWRGESGGSAWREGRQGAPRGVFEVCQAREGPAARWGGKRAGRQHAGCSGGLEMTGVRREAARVRGRKWAGQRVGRAGRVEIAGGDAQGPPRGLCEVRRVKAGAAARREVAGAHGRKRAVYRRAGRAGGLEMVGAMGQG
ncbi:hypothetical protein B0H19DRAFT_1084529 [Mycena capillaripes]|nr:hypothetical protein B0H19DRAFT_1084529 [Mycena capillaripes]